MRSSIALGIALSTGISLAQPPLPTVLDIEVHNTVNYLRDVSDESKIATVPGVVPVSPAAQRAFTSVVTFGDIVAVNGKPARGSMGLRVTMYYCGTAQTPGRMIADITCGCLHDEHLVIQQADGTPVGTIVTMGVGGGPTTPGAPEEATSTHTVVVGGTGAFLGARGQGAWAAVAPGVALARSASMLEDPANRRINGGGRWRFLIHLIPMALPDVLTTATGPAVYHGEDMSQVTAEKPARVGERLVMAVSSLGPVKPNLGPGKPFPPYEPGKLYEVNSPVEVFVNGRAAAIHNKVGWPTMTNVYRVDFIVPDGTAPGMATLGLSVAWINGPEVKIPIR